MYWNILCWKYSGVYGPTPKIINASSMTSVSSAHPIPSGPQGFFRPKNSTYLYSQASKNSKPKQQAYTLLLVVVWFANRAHGYSKQNLPTFELIYTT
jgi:hypothetical protein